MLSGKDVELAVPVIQVLPWRSIIDKIDAALLELSHKFLQAFGEGYFTKAHFEAKSEETMSLAAEHSYEYLKCALFHRVMGDMTTKSRTFTTLKELDEFYVLYHSHFSDVANNFLDERFHKRLRKEADLDPPISQSKLAMMEKIILLVHALDKTRFMLERLDMQRSVRDCENRVITLHENAKIFMNNLALIDCDNCQQRIVDPLKSLNLTLIKLLKNKGYGEVKIEGLSLLADNGDDNVKATMFAGLYAELSNLPVLSELKAIVDRLQKEKDKTASAELVEQVKVIATIRQVLRNATDKLLDESDKQLALFANQCESLTILQAAIKEMKEVAALFNQMEDLKHYCLDVLLPRSREVAKDATVQTRNPFNHRWTEAQEGILLPISGIVEDVQATCLQYQDVHEEFRKACETTNIKYNPLPQAAMLIEDWRLVNKQVAEVADQCHELLGGTAKLSMSLSQTNEQFILNFLKRHWPELSVGLTVPSALTAGLTLTVVAVTPWITLPVAAAGVLGGVGVSLFRDRFFPAPVVIPEVPQHVMSVEKVVDTKHINHRLFGTTDDPVIVTAVRSNPPAEPEETGVMSLLAGFARFQRQSTSSVKHQAALQEEFEQTWSLNK